MSIKCVYTFHLRNGRSIVTPISEMADRAEALQFARSCAGSSTGWGSIGDQERVEDITYVFDRSQIEQVTIEWM